MTAIPGPLATALAGRYQLERPIGQGGMATVYLAHDAKHARRVAVKVLRPDLAASLGAERFLREIRIAARLQHPHILLLIDSGEAEGFLYYVMPFVDGESLRGRLDREGRLDPAEALRLAGQVADALEYAHRHGVVHRDVKPENILLSDGHAVVADFGVAKAVSEASERGLTRTGFPVGTVGYMSPEQAAGFGVLDERSDVFSLGCVVYEMLVGRVPGVWPSDESIRVRRLLEAPPEHRERLDRLPGAVEQALVRAFALRPEARYPGPRALVDELRSAFEPGRRFSEQTGRQIVARAAEIEAAAPTGSGALSLGGLQQLAADVGIAPGHVERAARELTRPAAPPPKAHWFLGTPTRIVAERLVDGEVDDADYPTIVDEVRMTVGNIGQASTLGHSLSWRTVGPPGQVVRQVSMSVVPVNRKTRIRLEESLVPAAGGFFGGFMGALGGMSIPASIAFSIEALGMPALIPVFILTGVGGSWALARAALRSNHAKRRAELEALADRLAAFAADCIAAGRRGRLPG